MDFFKLSFLCKTHRNTRLITTQHRVTPVQNTCQMKSLQWPQKVGCFKNRAMNLWSLTSTTFFCLNAPRLLIARVILALPVSAIIQLNLRSNHLHLPYFFFLVWECDVTESFSLFGWGTFWSQFFRSVRNFSSTQDVNIFFNARLLTR